MPDTPLPAIPYRAPGAGPNDGGESVDLFIETLPTAKVRAAGVAAMIAGAGMTLTALQVLMLARNPAILLLYGVPTVCLALAYFTVSWGIVGSRMWVVALAFVAIPIACVVSLVVLFTVSLVGLIDGILAIVLLALISSAVRDVRRMASARARLAALPESAG